MIRIWRNYLAPQQSICVVAVTCGRKTCKALAGVVVPTDSDRDHGGAEAPDMVDATTRLRDMGWDVERGRVRCPEHRRRNTGSNLTPGGAA